MNNNVHENFAERVHVNQQEFFSERAYYSVARGQFGKNFPPPVLDDTNETTPLNDSKNAAGFAARANAVYCIQDLSERRASKTTESPFLRKADEESLSANVASYRIGCSGNLNEKTGT